MREAYNLQGWIFPEQHGRQFVRQKSSYGMRSPICIEQIRDDHSFDFVLLERAGDLESELTERRIEVVYSARRGGDLRTARPNKNERECQRHCNQSLQGRILLHYVINGHR